MKREDFSGKRLPNHPKVDYYEVFAKLLLEERFPDEFKNLEIADKPDLYNLAVRIGIEVTRACNEKEEKNNAIYSKSLQEQDKEKKQQMIDKINVSYKRESCKCKCCKNKPKYDLCKDEHNNEYSCCQKCFYECGCYYDNGVECDYHKYRKCDRYSGGCLFGIPDKDNFDRIIESFKDKIEKLNAGGYKKFDKYYLLIHSDIMADQGMIKNAIKNLNNIQFKYERKFYKIFVCVIGEIYVLDLDQNRGDILNIKNEYDELSKKAREYVIDIEVNS